VARAELDHLYKIVRPARYVILLCDKDGLVIEHRGEESEAAQFRRWGTWLGGVWSEEAEGTNGIGTCLADGRPVTVHRSQHFRARHINLTAPAPPSSMAMASSLAFWMFRPSIRNCRNMLTL
jgi:transcriptional regulator of acetoin/glycerol metabolism